MGRRGQFATEYLVVAAFMLLALLGGIYFFITEMGEVPNVHAQVQLMGNTLIDTANDLYFIGKPSKTTSQIIFPPGLQEMYVNQTAPKELVVLYETTDGEFEKVFLSRVNLAVNLNYRGRGKRDVVLEAKEKAVSICVVENICNCDGICQRPAENHTVCAADCCTEDCYACNSTSESLTPYTCSNDADAGIPHFGCYGHNGCNCKVAGC